MKQTTSLKMRIIHRYLGFFLAGIMAVYALSGILLIFRSTDFLKSEVMEEEQIEMGLSSDEISSDLRLGAFKSSDGHVLTFENGKYNVETGMVTTSKMRLPFILDKMTHLHKASTKSPLYYLNIFFGVALLFFVVSAFYMYLPGTDVFKKGVYFALGGMVLTLILIFV